MGRQNNLPHQLTNFVGRERELAEVLHLLSRSRLLTLSGPGGVGKTRLALQVVAGLGDEYSGGIWLVELAALTDPALVPQALAAAIGVREEPDRSLTASLIAFFEHRNALLLLDNCEHLASACAVLAETLLRACPNLRVLATSRQALGVAGEVVWPLPPLSTPDPAASPSRDDLVSYEAVRLFVDRARLYRPDFAITAQNAAAVAQLCSRLDGIPLAIELAAARVKVLAVAQIVARLDERFRLLAAPGTTALPRQQTLLALMDWSYDLLSEPERMLFRNLAVFAGGFTLEAAAAICADILSEYELIDLLGRLVDRSLLLVDDADGASRYRQLETIREYAAAKLVQSSDLELLKGRHRDWFLALAEASEDELIAGGQVSWLARLETEHDNLRAALDWSCRAAAAGRDVDEALRLAGALVWFWYFHGYLSEGREHIAGALAAAAASGAAAARTMGMAKSLSAAGALAFLQSDLTPARASLESSLVIWRVLADRRGTAFALAFLARVVTRQGDTSGRRLAEESAALFRELGERWGLALVLDFLGELARERGDNAAAAALHGESLVLYRALGHSWGVALELSNLGRVALADHNYAAALAYLEEALGLQREVGDRWSVAGILLSMAAVARARGDAAQVAALAGESLTLFEVLGDQGGIDLARRTLEHPVDAAATILVSNLNRIPVATASASYPNNLTQREVEVLRLLAEGLTDAQIAARLYLSARTVQAHLRSIYNKLDVTSRSAATRFALEHNLG